MKFYNCFILLLFIGLLADIKAESVLQFKHLSLDEGFSQSPVFSLYQNRKGFIWIGSREGLTRFDGYDFYLYKNEQIYNKNLGYSDIKALYEDEYDKLWVGTSNGLYVLDQQKEIFSPVIDNSSVFIFDFLRGENERLWVATSQGLKCFNVVNLKEITSEIPIDSIIKTPSKTISLLQEQGGIIWVGQEEGVIRFNSATGEIIPLPPCLAENKELSTAYIHVIKMDKKGNIWFGTENAGVFCFDYKTQSCINYRHIKGEENSLLSNYVRDIFVYDENTIWFGTRNGLSIFNKRDRKFQNHSHDSSDRFSLSHNTIWKMMRDRDNSVWIATYAGGINIFNEANLNFFNIGEQIGGNNGLNQPLVNAILIDNDNELIWAGTDGGGLNLHHVKGKKTQYYPIVDLRHNKSSNIIKCMEFDQKGNIWIGTLDGLSFFNTSTKANRFINIVDDIFKRVRINSLLIDKQDRLWVGTAGEGLRLIHTNEITQTSTIVKTISTSDQSINDMIMVNDSILYVATQNGLDIYNTSQEKLETSSQTEGQELLKGTILLSLYNDSQNRMWIGTKNGLAYFDTREKKTYFLEFDNLANEAIQSIIEDNTGNIWLSTYNGIYKVEFNYFRVPFVKKDFKVTHYTSTDGLYSNQFMQGAAVKDKIGRLYFGGVNGITYFEPGKMINENKNVQAIITDFLIHNKKVLPRDEGSPLSTAISYTEEIVLTYSQGYNIAFSLSVLNYMNADKTRYAYMMKGLKNNEEWVYTDNHRRVGFTNLEPGSYSFLVKASNKNGEWSDHITELRIKVLPPFWKTWIAYLLYFISIACVLFFAVRFFRSKIKLQQSLYYEHLERDHQQYLYQMKLDFFTNISHEIRTPLTLILAPLEKLEEVVRTDTTAYRYLLAIKENTNRLYKLVNELLDFRKAESGNVRLYVGEYNIVDFIYDIFKQYQSLADKKSIAYNFVSSDKSIYVFFDKNQLEKVIYNLLSNAFKFTSEAGTVELRIEKRHETVEIVVADDGKGISKEEQKEIFANFYQANGNGMSGVGSGIGLAYSKSIVELHSGTLSVFSDPDKKGIHTCFTITLPLGYRHFDDRQLIITSPQGENSSLTHAHVVENELIQEELPVRHSVMIVEDNAQLREFIKEMLSNEYYILEAENGEIAMKLATDNIPDIIITDIMMDKMDGLEMCKRIKADERTSHIPVIMLTARTTQENIIEGLETGADVYLVKPFSAMTLELHVHNLLATREANRKKFSNWHLMSIEEIQKISPDEKFIGKVLDIIKENLSNPDFDVPTLASCIGMSIPNLYKKLKALTNMSVNDFIKSNRLHAAALYLDQKQHSVSEISLLVGFNDRKYFSKEFKKQFGKNPTEYMSSTSIKQS